MSERDRPSRPWGQEDGEDEFGPYLIGGRLGSGGMGVVYRARDRRVPRQVALKILHPGLAAEPQYRERFRRESAMLSAAEHPHIVPMYNAGEIDGQLFLDMRLLDGDDLQTRLNTSGPIALGTAQAMIEGLADALDFVHGRGVLHRDIKPKNIMLTGFRDFAYLLDFGIAHAEHETALTERHAVVGSVDYLAPERFAGAPADRSSDIYALTAVLVAAVTGRPPYPGRNEVAAAAHAHGHEPVPRPGHASRELAPLDEVVARGMAKDPRDRYPRAREMAAAASDAFEEVRARAWGRAVPVAAAVTPAPFAGPAERSAAPGQHGRPSTRAGVHDRPARPQPLPAGWAPTRAAPAPAPAAFAPTPARFGPAPIGIADRSTPQAGRRGSPVGRGVQWALVALAAASAGLLTGGLFAPIVAHSAGYVDRHSARELAVQLVAPALLVVAAVLFRRGRRAFAVAAGVTVAMTVHIAAYLLEVVGRLHRSPGAVGPARALVVAALGAAALAALVAVCCALRRGLGGRAAVRPPAAAILVAAGAVTAVLAFRFARDGAQLTEWSRDPWSLGFVLAGSATVVLAQFVLGGRALAVGALAAFVLHAAVAHAVALSHPDGRSASGWLLLAGDAAVVLGGLLGYRNMRRRAS